MLPPRSGSFRFWFATQRWEWSAEVYQIHGYIPGEIEPTTQLLLAHKHPADREHVADTIQRSIDDGQPFSSRHRIIDVTGREHSVMVVSDIITDDDDTAVGTFGFYVDLSDTFAAVRQDTLDQRVPQVVEARAVIEQAKGVLMRMYRISSEQAFSILVWRSQETNTKLRDLAEQLLTELATLPHPPPDAVAALDHILLTLHTRTPQ